MDDLISRQAAIDELRKCRFVVDAIEKIRGLPTAQPEKVCIANITLSEEQILEAVEKAKNEVVRELPSAQQWIPCSERLPDERQDVYVTVLWDDYGDYITAYGMRTQFGWNLYSNAEGELIKGYTVVAWMPLSKPWKGE